MSQEEKDRLNGNTFANFRQAWKPGTLYTPGETFRHGNAIYRTNLKHTSPSAWDASLVTPEGDPILRTYDKLLEAGPTAEDSIDATQLKTGLYAEIVSHEIRYKLSPDRIVPEGLSGGTVVGDHVEIAAGTTGAASNMQFFFNDTRFSSAVVGQKITFALLVELSAELLGDRSRVGLNVIRNNQQQQNVGGAFVKRVLDSGLVEIRFSYTMQAGDEVLIPYVQIVGGQGNLTVRSRFRLISAEYAIGNSEAITAVSARIDQQTVDIEGKTLYVVPVPDNIAPEVHNGASIQNKRVVIPQGVTGQASNIFAFINATTIPGYRQLIGQRVRIVLVCSISANVIPLMNANLHVVRGTNPPAFNAGTDLRIAPQANGQTRISFNYLFTKDDTELRPFLQVLYSAVPLAEAGFFELDTILIDPGNQMTLQIAQDELGALIDNKALYLNPLPDRVVPEEHAGATVVGPRVVVPAGETGWESNIIAYVPISQFIDRESLLGQVTTLRLLAKVSENLLPILNSNLHAVRTSGGAFNVATNLRKTQIDEETALIQIDYQLTADDLELRPFLQLPSGADTPDDMSFFELVDIFYLPVSETGVPDNQRTYSLQKKVQDDQLLALNTAVFAAPSAIPVNVNIPLESINRLGNWFKVGNVYRTITSGSELRLIVHGTTRVALDYAIPVVAEYPAVVSVRYRPSGGAFTAWKRFPLVQGGATVELIDRLSTILTYEVQVCVSISETDPVWQLGAGLIVTRLRIQQGGTYAPGAFLKRMLGIGDSIMAGVAALPYYEAPIVSRAGNCVPETNWFHTMANELGLEPHHNGFGASGITRPGNGGVPRAIDNVFNYMQGVPKALNDQYAAIIVDHGTNDAGLNTDPVEFKETYRELVNALKGACPSSKIILKRPWNGSYQNEIQALAAETGTLYFNTTGYNVAMSDDLTHPSVVGGPPAGQRAAQDVKGLLAPYLPYLR
jgi:hypothetical protein